MKFEVKNPFYQDEMLKNPGDIVDIPTEELDRYRSMNVLGKEVVEGARIPPDNLDEIPSLEVFLGMSAEEQKSLLKKLQIDGDDSNEKKREDLYSAYLQSAVSSEGKKGTE